MADPRLPVALSLDQAKAALQEINAAFNQPEHQQIAEVAMGPVGGIVGQYQLDDMQAIVKDVHNIIHKYGFTADHSGLVQFFAVTRAYEEEDADFAQQATQFRSRFMPAAAPAN